MHGKSLSEALIFASTNPQYEDRLFIELQAQTWGEHVVLSLRTIFVHNMFSPCSAKRRASDKDLPVTKKLTAVMSCRFLIKFLDNMIKKKELFEKN